MPLHASLAHFLASLCIVYGSNSLMLEILPSATIKEYGEVTFRCNGVNVSSTSNVHLVHTWKGEIIRDMELSLLTLNSTQTVSLQHIGEYYCQAGQYSSDNVTVVVEATPRLLTPWSSEIYCHVDHRAVLSAVYLNVTSINESSLEWSKEGISLIRTPEQSLQTTNVTFKMFGKEVEILGTKVILQRIVTSSDYGYYDVKACTTEGCSSANIGLQKLYSPSPPSEFQVAENLTDGFYFQWRSGVNPEGEQMFRIAFRQVETSDWFFKEVNDSTRSELPVLARISGLLPETMYEAKVRAAYANDKDRVSNYSNIIVAFVKGPLQQTANFGPGIGIGIGVSVVVVVFISIIVYLVRFKRQKKKLAKHASDSRFTSSCEQVDNPSTPRTQHKHKDSKTFEPPELPNHPAPSLKLQPRPPVPGGHVNHAVKPEMPRPKASPKTRIQKAGAPTERAPLPLPGKNPVRLPLPPSVEDVYEPVEGEGESGEEYVVPAMPYENMH